MNNPAYHLQLKGFVGGPDFDRKAVDNILEKNQDKQVNVLIDSTGGNLATGLSISSAFKIHGNVAVHFVGLNASAATIASLGASHISIDAGAMYLVHQCSMPFFEWGSLNSDQFSTLIADCERIKADLDKLDLNIAGLYARKCKKTTAELLEVMKEGAWLTAKEALEWGFVDEITDLEDEEAPKLTEALACAMATAGMPIPNIPLFEQEKSGMFAKFLSALTSFFKPNSSTNNPISVAMKKTYNFLSAILADKPLTVTDGSATISEAQLDAIEAHIGGLNDTIVEKDEAIAAKDAQIADLQARLEKKPAASTTNVVDDAKKTHQAADETADFLAVGASASKLFNSLP